MAWQKAVEFVKLPNDSLYEIEVNLGTGKDFVHRMRVEISKMRAMVKARNYVIKPFKMMIKEIVPVVDGKERVILHKTLGSDDMTEELYSILNNLAVGSQGSIQ